MDSILRGFSLAVLAHSTWEVISFTAWRGGADDLCSGGQGRLPTDQTQLQTLLNVTEYRRSDGNLFS